MITKDQLQQMSDFECNKTLCTLLGKDVSGVCELRNQMTGAVTDYCGNPSDIMLLQIEHKISLLDLADGSWQAMKNNMIGVSVCFYDENPLRAIVCCLILFLQEKQK